MPNKSEKLPLSSAINSVQLHITKYVFMLNYQQCPVPLNFKFKICFRSTNKFLPHVTEYCYVGVFLLYRYIFRSFISVHSSPYAHPSPSCFLNHLFQNQKLENPHKTDILVQVSCTYSGLEIAHGIHSICHGAPCFCCGALGKVPIQI